MFSRGLSTSLHFWACNNLLLLGHYERETTMSLQR
jgi:hypothetical protein